MQVEELIVRARMGRGMAYLNGRHGMKGYALAVFQAPRNVEKLSLGPCLVAGATTARRLSSAGPTWPTSPSATSRPRVAQVLFRKPLPKLAEETCGSVSLPEGRQQGRKKQLPDLRLG